MAARKPIDSGKVYTTDELRGFVRPLISRYGLGAALLFGSYAREEADSASDIDILVEGGPTFRALDVYAFGEDLRSVTGKDVDVFEQSELNAGPFRDAVLREAVRL